MMSSSDENHLQLSADDSWTLVEDEQLRNAVKTFGTSNWRMVSQLVGRSGQQSCMRWHELSFAEDSCEQARFVTPYTPSSQTNAFDDMHPVRLLKFSTPKSKPLAARTASTPRTVDLLSLSVDTDYIISSPNTTNLPVIDSLMSPDNVWSSNDTAVSPTLHNFSDLESLVSDSEIDLGASVTLNEFSVKDMTSMPKKKRAKMSRGRLGYQIEQKTLGSLRLCSIDGVTGDFHQSPLLSTATSLRLKVKNDTPPILRRRHRQSSYRTFRASVEVSPMPCSNVMSRADDVKLDVASAASSVNVPNGASSFMANCDSADRSVMSCDSMEDMTLATSVELCRIKVEPMPSDSNERLCTPPHSPRPLQTAFSPSLFLNNCSSTPVSSSFCAKSESAANNRYSALKSITNVQRSLMNDENAIQRPLAATSCRIVPENQQPVPCCTSLLPKPKVEIDARGIIGGDMLLSGVSPLAATVTNRRGQGALFSSYESTVQSTRRRTPGKLEHRRSTVCGMSMSGSRVGAQHDSLIAIDTPSKTLDPSILFSPPSILKKTLHESFLDDSDHLTSHDLINVVDVSTSAADETLDAPTNDAVESTWKRVACGQTTVQRALVQQAHEFVRYAARARRRRSLVL